MLKAQRQKGQAVLECALAVPVLLLAVLGFMQWVLLIHARTVVDYSAFCACRTGIVSYGKTDELRERMKRSASLAAAPIAESLPLVSFSDVPGGFGAGAELLARLPAAALRTRIEKPGDGVGETPKAFGDLLQAEVVFYYKPDVPIVGRYLAAVSTPIPFIADLEFLDPEGLTVPGSGWALQQRGIPIRGRCTMRLESSFSYSGSETR